MPLEIDGFALLASIGAHRALFADFAGEIQKIARTLAVKQIKRVQSDIAALRALRSALGAETFALILDGFTDAEIAGLLLKSDRGNAEPIASGGAGRRRAHLDALLEGRREPAPPAKAKAARAPKPVKAEAGGKPGLGYVSAGRVRKPPR